MKNAVKYSMSNKLYPDIRQILRKAGFEVLRQGKHAHWRHPETGNGVSLSRNIKNKHLANTLLKSAGVHARL